MTRNPNFVLREVYKKAILLPICRNEVGNEPIHLNDVAVTAWKLTDDYETKNDLLVAITSLYGLEFESAEQTAVKQFIEQLIEMKLISE